MSGLEELLDLSPETVEGVLEVAGLDGISLCYAAGGVADGGGRFPDLSYSAFSMMREGELGEGGKKYECYGMMPVKVEMQQVHERE